ncbi:mutator-like transposase [Striga asiatica]|uniref:Mutator-like transposase n=1 Tax=Striga asiatica TaxID=4170 RepID=A0A5A7RGZ2_STRAF|nr:mutator-like transposase [Striga asiatica]
MTCQRCFQKGHNKKFCTNPQVEKPPKNPRGRPKKNPGPQSTQEEVVEAGIVFLLCDGIWSFLKFSSVCDSCICLLKEGCISFLERMQVGQEAKQVDQEAKVLGKAKELKVGVQEGVQD